MRLYALRSMGKVALGLAWVAVMSYVLNTSEKSSNPSAKWHKRRCHAQAANERLRDTLEDSIVLFSLIVSQWLSS